MSHGDLTPNKHTVDFIVSALKAQSASAVSNSITSSKSELDTHANMIVLGKECFIFEPTGKTCNVEPFNTDLGIAQNIPVVDAALAYDYSQCLIY